MQNVQGLNTSFLKSFQGIFIRNYKFNFMNSSDQYMSESIMNSSFLSSLIHSYSGTVAHITRLIIVIDIGGLNLWILHYLVGMSWKCLGLVLRMRRSHKISGTEWDNQTFSTHFVLSCMAVAWLQIQACILTSTCNLKNL